MKFLLENFYLLENIFIFKPIFVIYNFIYRFIEPIFIKAPFLGKVAGVILTIITSVYLIWTIWVFFRGILGMISNTLRKRPLYNRKDLALMRILPMHQKEWAKLLLARYNEEVNGIPMSKRTRKKYEKFKEKRNDPKLLEKFLENRKELLTMTLADLFELESQVLDIKSHGRYPLSICKEDIYCTSFYCFFDFIHNNSVTAKDIEDKIDRYGDAYAEYYRPVYYYFNRPNIDEYAYYNFNYNPDAWYKGICQMSVEEGKLKF